ncbi:MAG: DUF4878 domain-containing protein [Chitinophagaceae bacterium]|nr:MAG: DUF4878 domain-containing protein [Chitinophagaceae bacterium]
MATKPELPFPLGRGRGMGYLCSMRKLLMPLALVLLTACGGDDKQGPSGSESDVDAARNFIRASLDNDYAAARSYLVNDSTNLQYLETTRRVRAAMNKEENRRYHEASIRIYDARPLNDSTSIVTYDNSFRQQRNALKVVRTGGQWLVDLKYSFTDSTAQKP